MCSSALALRELNPCQRGMCKRSDCCLLLVELSDGPPGELLGFCDVSLLKGQIGQGISDLRFGVQVTALVTLVEGFLIKPARC